MPDEIAAGGLHFCMQIHCRPLAVPWLKAERHARSVPGFDKLEHLVR